MNRVKTSLLALLAMTAQVSAADLCDAGSAAALKTAAVQQELMVAGLTCGASAQYNRFVLSHQSELQKSDADLMAYFKSRDGGKEAGYDSYKTKLANLAAFRSAAEGARYCAGMARDFAAAQGVSLQDFVTGRQLLIAAPEACAVKYDLPEVAVAGVPSYALPARPYGAAPIPVARAAYDNPPPPTVQARSGSGDEAPSYRPSGYGPPPGWLPLRRARRWDWYGRVYNDTY